ncbi:MAG TPA: Stp1/IreP family PP2C-type Ser/Thr phosphatase [Solirubrobacteraceae bacterium]
MKMLRAAETVRRTDTGRQRRGNEDSSLARPPVFVVADGMGGARAGEVASQIAVEAFEQGLPSTGTPEQRLAEIVQEANRRIHDVSRVEHERAGMGTTLTAAFLDDRQVAIAHVGDSRAYLFRNGALKRLTRDHSLVGELVRQGKLTEEQAEEHPQRSIITRALGPEPTVEVDTWTYPASAGDVLMLCSDGLTSMITEERIAEVLASAASLEAAGDELIAQANEAGGRDNITVVLFRLEEVGADALEQPTTIAPKTAVAAAAPPSQAPVVPPPGQTKSARTAPAKTPPATVPARSPRPTPPQHRGRRYAKPLAGLLATVIVLFLVLGGGYLASRQLYFIGTNSQGIVTVYRGLPYDLPAGIHLYETFYVSGMPASQVPADRRSTLLNHHLRSQTDASSLVRSIELGQLNK